MGPHMFEDKGSLVWEEEWKYHFRDKKKLPQFSQYFQYSDFIILFIRINISQSMIGIFVDLLSFFASIHCFL